MRKQKGITLISLVVTIIVMLILAGITVILTIGRDGIILRVIGAEKAQKEAEEKENNDLNKLYSSMIIATNDSSQITISMEDLNKLIDQRIKEANVVSVPAGTVISYIVGQNAPEGYLKCDGTEYNISEYQALAEAIKTGFGNYNYYGGDGTTTFAVPDLRGEFLRGTGTATRNTGTGVAVGMHQDATNHVYIVKGSGGNIVVPKTTTTSTNEDIKISSSVTLAPYSMGTTWTSSNPVTYTSRPTNTSVLYCIKY